MNTNNLIALAEQLYKDGYKPDTILVEVDKDGMVVQQRGPERPKIHIDDLRVYLKNDNITK